MPARKPTPVRTSLRTVAIIAVASLCHAQSTLSAPPSAHRSAFDVATIKPNISNSGMTYDMDPPPNGYSVKNMTLKHAISNAYGIRQDLISGGPGWLESAHWDIDAKVTSFDDPSIHSLTKTQRMQMVQTLFADRFKLATHIETKQLPTYELTIAKNGPTLKPGKPDAQESWGNSRGDIRAEDIPISTLTKLLSQQLQRTVLDKTGLTGTYTFRLRWDDGAGTPPTGEAGAAVLPTHPPLLTAMQEQLGLKLEPSKGPTATLVIDHVEQPTEN